MLIKEWIAWILHHPKNLAISEFRLFNQSTSSRYGSLSKISW